jgi:hypothetical protein
MIPDKLIRSASDVLPYGWYRLPLPFRSASYNTSFRLSLIPLSVHRQAGFVLRLQDEAFFKPLLCASCFATIGNFRVSP